MGSRRRTKTARGTNLGQRPGVACGSGRETGPRLESNGGGHQFRVPGAAGDRTRQKRQLSVAVSRKNGRNHRAGGGGLQARAGHGKDPSGLHARFKINAIDIAQVVEDAGAAALTVHGRTAADFFKGSADWEKISAIRPFLKNIPLIGNGDLDSPQAVVDALTRYDVDGVMIARAALGRPWLFCQAQAALRGEPIPPDPSLDAQRRLLLHHFELICQRFGPEKGCILMRKYACCYAQGRRGARTFRSRVAVINSVDEFFQVVEESFPREVATQSASETSPVSISSGPLTCSSTSTGGSEKTL